MSDDAPRQVPSFDLPPPRKLESADRERILAEARAWSAEFRGMVAAIEAVTDEDLRARAR